MGARPAAGRENRTAPCVQLDVGRDADEADMLAWPG